MSKVLKIIAGIGLVVAGLLLPPGSQYLIAGFLKVGAGTLIAVGASLALTGVSETLLGPKIPKSQLGRLNVTLETTTPRKAVFGTTAMNLDLRYHEASGTNQEYIDYVIALAAHKVKSIDQIWFEEKLAWSASGGVTSTYTGYLTVNTITEGSASSYFTINGGSRWGASQRLTGCAQVHIRVKRTGNTKEAESPLVSGMPSRVTIIGDGALLYDPRKDSTVPGGSGTHRTNDQSTWGAYTDPDDTDNPALQLLWFLLGWRINGELSIGCGVPANRIDLPSFITAANICDETVTMASGTQKRYRTSGTATDSDDRMSVINTFLTSMNGTLRDSGGKLSLDVIKNDLADYVLTFDESDVLDDFEWNQTRGLNDTYTKVRGRYVDPSDNSLYQLVDYPEIEVAGGALDGIDRVMTLDLGYVEDGRRAQRIAKQALQRNQYKGMFSATFTAKAQGCTVGDVVRLTFPALGWTNKLFRVISQEIRFDGQVPLVLIEENAAIYAWDASDTAPVTPNAPTIYDPLNNPIIKGIADATAGISGYLTNEAITLAADSSGNVISFAMATGTFKMFDGVTDVTTTSAFALTASSGITATINATTGVYSVSAMSDPTGSATFTGTYNGTTITKVLSVAKSQAGTIGADGSSNAQVKLYRRSATTPAAPSGTFTYTFATGDLTGGTLNGWSQSVPAADGNPLWVIIASASSSAATDTIAAAEFSSPVIETGAGLNSATVRLYQRAASSPAVPSVSLTYTFSTSLLSGTLGSWTQSVPSGTNPLWVTQATAVSASATDTILSSEWSAPVIEAQNGDPGAPGTPATSAYLTNESVQLWAYANGTIVSYAPATGNFKVFSGTTDISSSFSLSTLSNPQNLTVTYSGQTYTVTGGLDANEDTATLTIRATGSGSYAGLTFDKVFSIAKATGGYEIVATLPTTNLFEGRIVFLTTDDKLYRYTGTAWTAAVPAVDISGQLADAQIAALAASKLTGQITETQITDNAITTNKIAASTITGGKIAAGTIQAGNIATDTITANQIAANAITATELATNAVTADKISAGAVTAAKINVTQLSAITADVGLLRTATTGSRTEIESNQIRVYDGSGTMRVRLGVW